MAKLQKTGRRKFGFKNGGDSKVPDYPPPPKLEHDYVWPYYTRHSEEELMGSPQQMPPGWTPEGEGKMAPSPMVDPSQWAKDISGPWVPKWPAPYHPDQPPEGQPGALQNIQSDPAKDRWWDAEQYVHSHPKPTPMAKGGAMRYDEGDLVEDPLWGDEEDTTPNPAPGVLRKLQFNPPEPAPDKLAGLRYQSPAAQNAPAIGAGPPGPMPGSGFLPGVPHAPAGESKAAAGPTLAERNRQRDLEAWHNLWKQEGDDIFNKSNKPLLDYITDVGKGNVGAWHTQPGISDLSRQSSNDPNSYWIGFDPASSDRIYSHGQNAGWFSASTGKPYTGNTVYAKTSIFPMGAAPSDEEPTVQQSYGTPAPAAPPAAAGPAMRAPAPAETQSYNTPATKSSFVPRGTGVIDMATPFMGMIDAAALRYGVPRDRLFGHVMAESSGNPNVVSRKGAQGIMQIMPRTAADLGVKNPFDPAQAIDGGARYLAQLYKRFGNWDQASMAYNAGPTKIARGIVPSETRAYLPKVKRLGALVPPSRNAQQAGPSMRAATPAETQQVQQPDIPKAELPPAPQPIDQSDRLKDILKLIGLSGWAKGGEVHGDAAQDREQMLGILREKKLIKKSNGGRAEFAKGGISDLPDQAPKKIPGKDVLHRAPLGHAVLPVLHTTIVIGISPKKGKKGQKKADGGRLETSPNFPDSPPRRPEAIPPRRGKTPRGVGKALRGWGKTGR